MTEQDRDLSFVISKVKLYGMGTSGAAEVVRIPAWKDDCLEVVGSCFCSFGFFFFFLVIHTQALCKGVSLFGQAFGGNQLPLQNDG